MTSLPPGPPNHDTLPIPISKNHPKSKQRFSVFTGVGPRNNLRTRILYIRIEGSDRTPSNVEDIPSQVPQTKEDVCASFWVQRSHQGPRLGLEYDGQGPSAEGAQMAEGSIEPCDLKNFKRTCREKFSVCQGELVEGKAFDKLSEDEAFGRWMGKLRNDTDMERLWGLK